MKYFINGVEVETKEFHRQLREASNTETKFKLDDELDVFYENFRTSHPSNYQYEKILASKQEEAYYECLAQLVDSTVKLGDLEFFIMHT